jgi:hypothetical protein
VVKQRRILSLLSTARRALFRLTLSRADILYLTSFALPYLAMLYFFAEVDVYHHHFFAREVSAIYNVFRCIFIVYFFWTMYFTGEWTLGFIDRSAPEELTFSERIGLGFFAGAVLWQALMLVLGYLSLYTRPVAIILFSPFVLCSYFLVRPTFHAVASLSRDAWKHSSALFRLAIGILILCLATTMFALLLVKGLYPSGGHDYFTHYFYYLTAVLKNHGIWPNNVWYHYYYQKAMGWYFLGMLLTDPLAPSLINFAFVTAAAFVLFALIEGSRHATLWSWAVVVLYVFFYILGTEAPHIADTNDGWGEFSKPHEINAAFLIAIVWTNVSIVRDYPNIRWPFVWVGAACSVGATWVEQPTAFIICGYYSLLVLYAGALRHWRLAVIFIVLGCLTGAALASVLILNYATTGVPMDELVHFTWPIVDLNKLERVGWIFDMLNQYWAHSILDQYAQLFTPAMFGFLVDTFRLDILAPFAFYQIGVVLLTLFPAALLLWGRFGDLRYWATAEVLFVFVLTTLIFSVTLGQTQDVSFFRYTSFNVPVIASLVAAIWICISGLIRSHVAIFAIKFLAPAAATALTIFAFWQTNAEALSIVIANAGRFATGSYSIDDAYSHQEGWPGRRPFGAIYPGSRGAWETTGPDVRIWSLHAHAYCMLPDCLMEHASPFVMSPRIFEIMLGSGDHARQILKSEGMNYFLFSTEIVIFDWLPLSDLFSPAHIGQYLGIKWTDGATYLLTWLGPGIEPLSTDWINKYSEQVNRSPTVVGWKNELTMDKMRDLYQQLYRTPRPRWGRDLVMP